MYVEGLLPSNLCLVTLLNSEQCLQFERFRLQHIQMVDKTSIFKTKLAIMLRQAELTIIPFDV